MSENKYPKEFEEYWKQHEQQLINVSPKVLQEERKNNGKMNTAGDWLLFVIPLIAGIGFMNTKLIANEMLNLICGMVIVVICFALEMLIRPYVTGKRSVAEIDQDIKDYFFAVYEKDGIKGIESL